MDQVSRKGGDGDHVGSRRLTRSLAACMLIVAAGCGGGGGGSDVGTGGVGGAGSTSDSSSSTGSTGAAGAPSSIGGSAGTTQGTAISASTEPYGPVDPKFYAASRFLEHASFGPTPADVEALKDGRFAAWIDAQLAMAPVPLDASSIRDVPSTGTIHFEFMPLRLTERALTAPDQLRTRMAWALSQLLVVSQGRVGGFAQASYFNLLNAGAFGKYRDLLRSVTLHAAMGFYQDNVLNQRAGAFPGATANENYARELMQLFSVGLVELNLDGTPRLDASGKVIQTYSQREVEHLARALTGWQFTESGTPRPQMDFGNFAVPLSAFDFFHDKAEKRILGGRIIPPNGTPASDVEAILDTLSQHPNIAPFISYRLIQHFVTGDPSPAYVARMAQVFRQTDGDLGQVLKAILLDAEARAGDNVAAPLVAKGKVKEPFLGKMQLMRAFGCRTAPLTDTGQPDLWIPGQSLFFMPTVFNYYPPNFKFPGTQLTAPESKLLNGDLLQFRGGYLPLLANGPSGNVRWKGGGCDMTAWDAANGNADQAVDLISKRLMRGAMPLYVRDAIKAGVYARSWSLNGAIYDGAGLALLSPSWGVMK